MNETLICQITSPLPAQCCGKSADQIWLCEEIAPPGHRCRVGDHTVLHERMGNGRSCAAVEDQLRNRGGLKGWRVGGGTKYTVVGH